MGLLRMHQDRGLTGPDLDQGQDWAPWPSISRCTRHFSELSPTGHPRSIDSRCLIDYTPHEFRDTDPRRVPPGQDPWPPTIRPCAEFEIVANTKEQ